MDSVTSRIFKNETLVKNVSRTVAGFLQQLIDSKASDMGLFYQCRYVRYDLKYIAKPDLMPQLVQETQMVEDLIDAVNLFHYADVQKNDTQMAEFGDQNT